MSKLNWEFAKTGGGDVTGRMDPVTLQFRGHGDLSYYLARESGQNIIDARIKDLNEPAKASFELLELQADNFPKIHQLKEHLKLCRDADRKKDNYEFYNKIIEKIERNRFIPVLKISDFNTTGLSGDDENEEGNYFLFMKSVGMSFKSGSSGGSFGLGKGAYFLASSFRTIFVSSVYDGDKVVFQGKARLRSVKKNGIRYQGNGSFGLLGQFPIRDGKLIPKYFRRDRQGTDAYILGFENRDEWKKDMKMSVINNFWPAVTQGKFEALIDGSNINRRDIERLMNLHFKKDAPDKKESPNPWPYYLAYKEGRKIHTKLPTLGHVDLYLVEGANFPNKIAYARATGMVIYKKTLNAPINYAGFFVCENEKGNEILKSMENPSHDEWNKNNAIESEYKDLAEEAYKELGSFVRKSVAEMFPVGGKESLEVGGLEEYLWLEGDLSIGGTFGNESIDEVSQAETGQEISKEMYKKLHPKISRKLDAIKKVTKGTLGGNKPIIRDKNSQGGTSSGGEEGEGDENVVLVKDVKYKSFATRNEEDEVIHTIILKAPINIICDLELRAGTDDSFEEVEIERAYYDKTFNCKVDKNKILNVHIGPKGERKIKVIFKDRDKYALNIKVYENK